jgi:hypothetical protein
MPGYDMNNPMMGGMPGMGRGMYPGYPMGGFPMMAPPMYPRGTVPPLPGQMDPMAKNMGRGGMKPFPDPKMMPGIKKEKEKTDKKEDLGRVLDISPPMGLPEIFKTIQVSIKNLQEPFFLNTSKRALTDVETRLKDKKVKNTAKEVTEFLAALPEKIKEAEKKDKKKSSSSEQKISEYEIVKALHEVTIF